MHRLIKGLAVAGAAALAGSVFAASIPLYQAPDAGSKVATQVQAGTRLIPIYRSNAHQGWVKVADPTDGKVGWLRLEQPKLKWVSKQRMDKSQSPAKPELKSAAKSNVKAPQSAKPSPQAQVAQSQGFVQRVVTTDDGTGPKRYQVIEYSGPKKLNDKQIQQVIRNMERRNLQMQRDMQRMMSDMQRNFFSFQPVMPSMERIVVVPAQAQAQDAPVNNGKASVTEQKPEKTSFWQKIKNKVSQ